MENTIFKDPKETEKSIIVLLQLAKRAGKLIYGYNAVERCIKKRQNRLIIISKDISERTKSRFMKSLNNVEFIVFGTKKMLGMNLNCKDVGILCITDKNFSDGIKRTF